MMHKHTNRKGSDVSHEVTRCIRKGAEIARRGAWGCAWETHEASRGGGGVRRDRAADDEVDMVRVSELCRALRGQALVYNHISSETA